MHRRTILGLVILLLATATPVAAHYRQVTQGQDYAYVNSGHTQVGACDQETER
jgi:hypothetical protein